MQLFSLQWMMQNTTFIMSPRISSSKETNMYLCTCTQYIYILSVLPVPPWVFSVTLASTSKLQASQTLKSILFCIILCKQKSEFQFLIKLCMNNITSGSDKVKRLARTLIVCKLGHNTF